MAPEPEPAARLPNSEVSTIPASQLNTPGPIGHAKGTSIEIGKLEGEIPKPKGQTAQKTVKHKGGNEIFGHDRV